ncbi:hypothetical protein BD410DRAFT_898463 [Rickenella mellea]|uniref:F-box domain-containing protein n=1 Tax=Rickenella mellea TaxID=50990 RepID=A0A4Y7Q4F3_9AGAM|nr:hypothetical protein BD410DRAFT_898463 [Rickenella mellea]
MSVFPKDILVHIAKFIPDDELQNMLQVSSLFLDLALNVRYHEADFNRYRDYSKLLRKMEYPDLARRVRRVVVNPCNWAPLTIAEIRAAEYHKASQVIIDIVCKLTHVVEFYIDWRTSPSPQELEPFLKAAWATFGANLQVMSIIAPPDHIKGLQLAGCATSSLREVYLSIGDAEGEDADKGTLETVLPFVSASSSTMRLLSISSRRRTLDLSDFFHSLPLFPELENIAIRIHLDKKSLSDISSLSRLLQIHSSSLREVELFPPYWRQSFLDDDMNGVINFLEVNLAKKAILTNLHSLRLMVPAVPDHDEQGIELVIPYVLRSATTLENLTLEGRFLKYVDFEKLVGASPYPALRHLFVKVDILTPKLMDLLAKRLLNLQRLHLDIFGSGGDANAGADSQHEGRCVENDNFEADMKKYDLRSWQLREIIVHYHAFIRMKQREEARIKDLLIAAVPSLIGSP